MMPVLVCWSVALNHVGLIAHQPRAVSSILVSGRQGIPSPLSRSIQYGKPSRPSFRPLSLMSTTVPVRTATGLLVIVTCLPIH